MRRADLVADCARCAAVCCVALAFDAGEDFAFDKPAAQPCRHLTGCGRCAIHAELAARGQRGCAAFDCYGAGPRVTRDYGGPGAERRRNLAFPVLAIVHELIWQLGEAAKLAPGFDAQHGGALARELAALEALAESGLHELLAADLGALRRRARALLRRVGETLAARPGDGVR